MNNIIRYLALLIVGTNLLMGPVNAADAPSNTEVTIWSDGTRLAGNLWKPAGLAADKKVPGILLVHGWGGLKNHLNQAYAPQFAELGYIVLTFDYRGWGDSDGKFMRVGDKPVANEQGEITIRVKEVREIVDPLDQLEDIRSAMAYLMGEPQVMADRLGIWGSSLGGGLALKTAIDFPAIKVLVSQVGSVNPQHGLLNAPVNNPLHPANIWNLKVGTARGDLPPIPAKELGVPGLRGVPDWERYARYDPFADVDQLESATLVIDAKDEELFDISVNGNALINAIKDRLPNRYEVIPGKHYDIYRDDGYRAALALEMEWFKSHL